MNEKKLTVRVTTKTYIDKASNQTRHFNAIEIVLDNGFVIAVRPVENLGKVLIEKDFGL